MMATTSAEHPQPSDNELLIFDVHSKDIITAFCRKNFNIKPLQSLSKFSQKLDLAMLEQQSDKSLVVQSSIFNLIYSLLRMRRSESVLPHFHHLMSHTSSAILTTKLYKKCLTIAMIWELYINTTFNQLDATLTQLRFIEQTSNIGKTLKSKVRELIGHLGDPSLHNVLPEFITDDWYLNYFAKLLKRCNFTLSELSDEYNAQFVDDEEGGSVSESQSNAECVYISQKEQDRRKSKRINRQKDNNTTKHSDHMDLTNVSNRQQNILDATNPPQFSTPLRPPSKRRTKNTLPPGAKRTLFNPDASMIFDQTPTSSVAASSVAASSPGSVTSDVSVLSSSVLVHGRGKNKWTQEEIENLIVGVKRYGTAWRVILENCEFNRCRTNVHLKDKWRQICKVKDASS